MNVFLIKIRHFHVFCKLCFFKNRSNFEHKKIVQFYVDRSLWDYGIPIPWRYAFWPKSVYEEELGWEVTCIYPHYHIEPIFTKFFLILNIVWWLFYVRKINLKGISRKRNLKLWFFLNIFWKNFFLLSCVLKWNWQIYPHSFIILRSEFSRIFNSIGMCRFCHKNGINKLNSIYFVYVFTETPFEFKILRFVNVIFQSVRFSHLEFLWGIIMLVFSGWFIVSCRLRKQNDCKNVIIWGIS